MKGKERINIEMGYGRVTSDEVEDWNGLVQEATKSKNNQGERLIQEMMMKKADVTEQCRWIAQAVLAMGAGIINT